MAENTAEGIAKEPVADVEDKARDTTDSLPPITKESAATAEASLVPSVPTQSTTEDAPAAPSSDATAKPEVPAPVAEGQEDSTNELNKPDAAALQPENPSDTTPAAAPQPATTETATSGIGSSASTGPGEVVEPPKPVSLEEIRDEELPDAKPVEAKKPADEASKTDTSTPAENGDGATSNKRKADAAEDAAKPEANSVENQDTQPPEKKLKTNGTATNGAARKPGRPRKDKNAVTIVGKTARKTRSQGAAE
ncbi:hypothetical protein F5Y12DRAFT_380923 [Xylaria sp. FL1777]|nr:hypothetical protein F5Y12DRAFT_380923 [Xylaria sp. FL1777]